MGLIKIVNCDSPNRSGDIVFIHGLGGSSKGTWNYKAQKDEDSDKEFWPYWLGQDRPDLGIWTFDYEAKASAWQGSAMPIFDQGGNLLNALEIRELGQKPIIFIVHSLGGLIFKEMLQRAGNFKGDFRKQDIVKQTKGIVFLATPHAGSDLAKRNLLMQFLRAVGQPNEIVGELEAHASQLRKLDEWYRNNCGSIPIKAYCEDKKTFYGMADLGIVVDKDSANPKMNNVMPVVVAKDHITIAKPSSREDEVYMGVRLFIKDHIPPTTNSIAHQLALPSSSADEINFSQLESYLERNEWRQADEETAKIISQSVGYTDVEWLTEDDIQKIPCQVLKKIDELWSEVDRHLGFKVQKKIYKFLEQKYSNDPETLWIEFGNYVCWRKNGQWLDYNSIFNSPIIKDFLSDGYLPRLRGIITGMKYFFSRCDKCL